jgi:predicted tellurium resistance membrane protein TerC
VVFETVLNQFMEWLIKNKEWVFSGIGVAVLAWIGGWLFLRSKSETARKQKQIQRSGDNSINIQAGGNIHWGDKIDGRDSKTK